MEDQIYSQLKKGKKEGCSEEERQEMLALFHQPKNEYGIKEVILKELFSEEIRITPMPNFTILFKKLWASIENKKDQHNKERRILYNFLRIAAAIIIGLFIGIYITSMNKTEKEPEFYSAYSPKGSISQAILPDSTIIYLNADTRIRYSMDSKDNTREVFIEGEAWFDVQKNEQKPFVVHTPFYDVFVTGTQFDVKAYEDDDKVTTTLEKGTVYIRSTENSKNKGEVQLKPGQQIILLKDSNKLLVKSVETKWFTSWKDNKLIFVNMNIGELEILLERKYGVDIEIKNKDILNLHFDGTIKDESIIEFLEIIKNTLPISYNIVGQKIEITNSTN